MAALVTPKKSIKTILSEAATLQSVPYDVLNEITLYLTANNVFTLRLVSKRLCRTLNEKSFMKAIVPMLLWGSDTQDAVFLSNVPNEAQQYFEAMLAYIRNNVFNIADRHARQMAAHFLSRLDTCTEAEFYDVVEQIETMALKALDSTRPSIRKDAFEVLGLSSVLSVETIKVKNAVISRLGDEEQMFDMARYLARMRYFVEDYRWEEIIIEEPLKKLLDIINFEEILKSDSILFHQRGPDFVQALQAVLMASGPAFARRKRRILHNMVKAIRDIDESTPFATPSAKPANFMKSLIIAVVAVIMNMRTIDNMLYGHLMPILVRIIRYVVTCEEQQQLQREALSAMHRVALAHPILIIYEDVVPLFVQHLEIQKKTDVQSQRIICELIELIEYRACQQGRRFVKHIKSVMHVLFDVEKRLESEVEFLDEILGSLGSCMASIVTAIGGEYEPYIEPTLKCVAVIHARLVESTFKGLLLKGLCDVYSVLIESKYVKQLDTNTLLEVINLLSPANSDAYHKSIAKFLGACATIDGMIPALATTKVHNMLKTIITYGCITNSQCGIEAKRAYEMIKKAVTKEGETHPIFKYNPHEDTFKFLE